MGEGLRKAMEDKELGGRMKELSERTMGEEARVRIAENLRNFTDNLKRITRKFLGLSPAIDNLIPESSQRHIESPQKSKGDD